MYSLYVVKLQSTRGRWTQRKFSSIYIKKRSSQSRTPSVPTCSARALHMISALLNVEFQSRHLSLENAAGLSSLVAVNGLKAGDIVVGAQVAAVVDLGGALAVVADSEALGVGAGEVGPAWGDESGGLARDGAGRVLVEADPQGGGADEGARARDEAAAQVVVVVHDLVEHEGGEVVPVGPCGVGDEVDGRAVVRRRGPEADLLGHGRVGKLDHGGGVAAVTLGHDGRKAGGHEEALEDGRSDAAELHLDCGCERTMSIVTEIAKRVSRLE